MKLGRTLMAATMALSLTSGVAIAQQQSDFEFKSFSQLEAFNSLFFINNRDGVDTDESGEPTPECPRFPHC